MVYFSSLVGGITVSASIAIMTVLQGMFKGDDDCKKAHTVMFWTTMAALLGTIAIFIINWLPLIPATGKAAITSIAAFFIILAIAGGNSMAAAVTKMNECAKGRMYAIINTIVLVLIDVIVLILFFI
uniref:Uncharacterized protein n=1 Tax=Marseillevirus LCMAC101 TaxID=2506602 RepID=A0A481YSW3_9VIRU|nr:MAG: hypothetical protein LCMAC101_06750 [Marseillevirus LCMAC101]